MSNPQFLNNKRILVTGCCGTVGAELCNQLLSNEYNISELIGIDNNESQLLYNEQRFSMYNTRFILGDVRDRDQLSNVMDGIDIVFHCAGLKHVILCERAPAEAIQTNILGVQNIIYAAIQNKVSKVIFTSSDKAVNPTNVMGTSKLMGERLMTAANSNFRGQGTLFASTRFGNVLGSRGSVIPIFHQQIKKGGPVTLTDPEMTRFIMSIEQSVSLVITSAEIVRGGEVFVTKMPVIKITDLANIMTKELSPVYGFEPRDIKIIEAGMKPGEKMYEELMSLEEIRRALELKKYFVILPAFRGIYREIEYDYPDVVTKEIDRPYISQEGPFMTREELKQFLNESNLLQPMHDESHPVERYWPGDF